MNHNKVPKSKLRTTSGSGFIHDEIKKESDNTQEVDLTVLRKEGSRVATLSALYDKMDFFQPKRMSRDQREDQNKNSVLVEENPSTFNPYRPSLSNITPITPFELPTVKIESPPENLEEEFTIKPRPAAVATHLKHIPSLEKGYSLPVRNATLPHREEGSKDVTLSRTSYTLSRREGGKLGNFEDGRPSSSICLTTAPMVALTPMTIPKIMKPQRQTDSPEVEKTGAVNRDTNALLTEEELDRIQEGMLFGEKTDHLVLRPDRLQPDDKIENEEEKRAFLRRRSSEMTEKAKLKKVIINFYMDDEGYRTLVVDEMMLARNVVDSLIEKNHLVYDLNWQLMEENMDDKIERFIEDHEKVLSIYESWPQGKKVRFTFRKNLRKVNCFQTNVIDPYKLAEMSGELWIKKPNSKWSQLYCFLNGCRLFYSTKKNAVDKKHHKLFLELNTVLMHQCPYLQTRKMIFGSPTDFLILLKKINGGDAVKDIFCVCAVDGPSYESWYQAIRFATSSVTELRKSYHMALTKNLKSSKEDNQQLSSVVSSASPTNSMRNEATSLFAELWYQGEMEIQAAEQALLNDKQDGCFLVRFEGNQFWLAIVAFHRVHHIPIKMTVSSGSKQYEIPNAKRAFPSIASLIEHYSKEAASTVIPCKLTKGFQRKVFQF